MTIRDKIFDKLEELNMTQKAFSEKTGIAEEGLAGQLENDFASCGLPVDCPFGIRDLADAMKKDKKAEGGLIHFVLPIKIGLVETRDFSADEVVRLLEE